MTQLKPFAFCNGDESTRRGADMVRQIVFGDFPSVDADTGVEARLKTNDECIKIAADAIRECGSGVKISTASNDPRIKEKGWKSANILLRPLCGAIGMYRMTMGPGGYKKPVAVFRYGSGDFYSEKSCELKQIDGHEVAVITQHLNVSDFKPFAEMAVKKAKEYSLKPILASKWTISEGEKLIIDRVKPVLVAHGMKEGEKRGTGDFWCEITDVAAALVPISAGGDQGGWMIITGNANGDTIADIADFQHGNNTMGSEVICRDGFSYHELPGGTAPGRQFSDFKGDQFFSPVGTLVAFCGSINDLNPQARSYCDAVMAATIEYMGNTDKAARCTQTMLEFVAKQASAHKTYLKAA
jgi:isocitrate dehydrogenase